MTIADHVPSPLTSFVGRTQEIDQIERLLASAHCRLVTIAGPGGIGKTRLAIECARRLEGLFRDGAVFVPLDSIDDAGRVAFRIAQSLDVRLYEKEAPEQQLIYYLKDQQRLLVLDNFEHLLEAAGLIKTLLEQVPQLKIIVTSREVLSLVGEHVYELAGLPVRTPAQPSETDTSDALQLFAERAQQVRYSFNLDEHRKAVVRICQLVEGMPLAIELAASWVKVLEPEAIAASVSANLNFLSSPLRDLPPRHRSIRAVFDQSWAMLNPEERTAFSRLSVFRGGFDAAAAHAVATTSLEILTALVDQSLVKFEQGGRYTVHELLRQYGEEHLKKLADEYHDARDRHSDYFLQLVADQSKAIKGHDQILALREIEARLDNIRLAWDWAVMHQQEERVFKAFDVLALYYQMRCRLIEAYDIFTSASAQFEGRESALLGCLLLARIWFSAFSAQPLGDYDRIAEHALNLLGNSSTRGIAAMVLCRMYRQSPVTLVQENFLAYQERGDQWGMAWTLMWQGHYTDDLSFRERCYLRSIELFEAIGDRWGATWPRGPLGLLYEQTERYAEAFALYQTRLEDCQRVGDAGGVAWSLQQIAKVALELDNRPKAIYYCRESLKVALEIPAGSSVAEAVMRIASLFARIDLAERAAELYALLAYDDSIFDWLRENSLQALAQLQARLDSSVYSRAVNRLRNRSLHAQALDLLDELAMMLETDGQETRVNPSLPDPLTEREIEVLRLVADGLSNRKIAEQLVVSPGTVKKHLNNIFGKLQAERRTEAVKRARELGVLA